MNQLTLQQLLEAHFLRLRGFQAWGVLLANLVQYNQHYTWNGLIYLLVMAPASLLRKQVLTNLFCGDRICILPTPAISLRQWMWWMVLARGASVFIMALVFSVLFSPASFGSNTEVLKEIMRIRWVDKRWEMHATCEEVPEGVMCCVFPHLQWAAVSMFARQEHAKQHLCCILLYRLSSIKSFFRSWLGAEGASVPLHFP